MRYLLYIIVVIFLSSLNITGIQAQEISSFDREMIEQLVRERVGDFLSYISEISSERAVMKEEKQLRQKYIDVALGLFLGEGNPFTYIDERGMPQQHHAVRISVANGGMVEKISLKNYLARLLVVLDKGISFGKCAEFRIEKKPIIVDGIKYLAVASVVFVQYNSADDKLNGKGIQKIVAYVRRQVVMTSDSKEFVWSVKLGDISVKEGK